MPDTKSFNDEALDYHEYPTPGKIAIRATTQLTSQRDLALAYSPGVAAPCLEIEKDPMAAYRYTSRGNMVAVISNGTAVLGLGDIGALASKPVMEGKSVLFKKFAAIDSIDIEVDEKDVDAFCDTVARLEPSFGGINLEDISAPACFEIEKRLKERMNIPVFHDDQHGTAIIVGAAFKNWLKLSGRQIEDIKLVANGAGASAISCLKILKALGLPKENILVCDRKGVIYEGRTEGMDEYKAEFAVNTNARSLDDAIEDADVFLGLSAAGALTKENCAKMAGKPLVMALANPTPEIMPEDVRAVHPDAVICTGRSDYTNQVNNVLCFPFLFRGALDCRATGINEAMKLACVEAIAKLAQAEANHEVATVYADEDLEFGMNYLIPKPFDPRLIVEIPLAVVKAAMDSGIAQKPIEDFEAYRRQLQQHFYRSNLIMGPIIDKAKANPKKIAFAEGEEERVLMAVQTVLDEGLAKPILIGRRRVLQQRIEKLNLRIELDKTVEVCDPEDDPRYRDYWTQYHKIMERRGITPNVAKTVIRTNNTVIAALMVERGEADALICGVVGQYVSHLRHLKQIIGLKEGVETPAALTGLIMSKGNLFITDTHVNHDPSAHQLSEMTILAADEMKKFGLEVNAALVSHSNFGSSPLPSACKMREALQDVQKRAPELKIEGEMHADAALSASIRETNMPNSTMVGAANLLIMPNVESANITYNALKVMNEATVVGPILLGMAKPVHICTSAATPRTLVNLAALSSVSV
jgi:malate dehydrogenase (oxaloacetate-decarboxylating)(NADP+)